MHLLFCCRKKKVTDAFVLEFFLSSLIFPSFDLSLSCALGYITTLCTLNRHKKNSHFSAVVTSLDTATPATTKMELLTKRILLAKLASIALLILALWLAHPSDYREQFPDLELTIVRTKFFHFLNLPFF